MINELISIEKLERRIASSVGIRIHHGPSKSVFEWWLFFQMIILSNENASRLIELITND